MKGTPSIILGLEIRVNPEDKANAPVKHFTLLGAYEMPDNHNSPLDTLRDVLHKRANGFPIFDCSAYWRNRVMPRFKPDEDKPGSLIYWEGVTYRIRGIQGTMGLTDFMELTQVLGANGPEGVQWIMDRFGAALEVYMDTHEYPAETPYDVRIVYMVEHPQEDAPPF